MQDVPKTKSQLMSELEALRRRVAEIESLEAINLTGRERNAEALQESEARVRALLNASTESAFLLDTEGIILELNERAARRFNKTVPELIGVNVLDLLPRPLAKTRKARGNETISTGKPVRFEDQREGRIMDTVIYPVFDYRGRVTQLAVYSRDITSERRTEGELKNREAALKAKTSELKEVNRALRALLKQRDRDKKELEEKVVSNVKALALPYVKQLKKGQLRGKGMACLKVLESVLNEIVSPFIHELSSQYTQLTPREIQIAQLIKEGKTSREIAELLGSSERTVESHREHIRVKLGLKHRKVNLRSYLSAI